MQAINHGTRVSGAEPAGMVQARFPLTVERGRSLRVGQPVHPEALRDALLQHLDAIGLSDLGSAPSKQAVRDAHAEQRTLSRARIVRALGPRRNTATTRCATWQRAAT